MDQILVGILNSDQPVNVKKIVIAKIAQAGKDGGQPPELVSAVLRSSLTFIVDGETEAATLSQPVFVEWSIGHQPLFVEFFNEEQVTELVENPHSRPSEVLWTVAFSLKLVHESGSASYTSLCHAVGRKASYLVCSNITDFDLVMSVCSLLLEHRDCVPQESALHTFATMLIRAVSRFHVPADQASLAHFVTEVPNCIGKLMYEIWIRNAEVVADSLQMVFDIMTKASNTESITSLGAIVQFVPDVFMRSMLQAKVSDTSLSDETALLVLMRMLDMLCWPSVSNIDMWMITFMRALASAHRYSVLMCLAISKVDQVCIKG